MGLPTILFLIFLTLKLMGEIDWSWWWVTAPLWIEVVLLFLVLFVFGVATKSASRGIKKRNGNYF